jgi:ABC-type nitrate/sulfonate/bicarbonate transport system ATPase subunit
MVFQSPCLLPWLSALANEALAVGQAAPGLPSSRRRELAAEHLEQVGLGESLDRRPEELSAGMRQRVGIARALALSPKVLLLDEPFGMLDSLTRIELQDLLLRLWDQERRTTLLVTHDVDEAIFLSDRVVMMTDGPEAKVGSIHSIPFERPRERRAVLESPLFDGLRQEVLGFLSGEAIPSDPRPEPPPPEPASAEPVAEQATAAPRPSDLVGSAAASHGAPWSRR